MQLLGVFALVSGVISLLIAIFDKDVAPRGLNAVFALVRIDSFQVEVIVPSWTQNLRKRERVTKNEMEILDKLYRLHLGPNPPEEWTSLHLDKEVVARANAQKSGLAR